MAITASLNKPATPVIKVKVAPNGELLPTSAAITLKQQETPTIANIGSVGDVDTSAASNGALLVYKSATRVWTATTQLDAQNMEGGEY